MQRANFSFNSLNVNGRNKTGEECENFTYFFDAKINIEIAFRMKIAYDSTLG